MKKQIVRRVFSKGLTNNLLDKGHRIVKIENHTNSNKMVFVFEDNKNFQTDIDDILKSK
ncbi:hypothetical protein ATL39_0062 [Sinobaca qinghaiensis]|uniref:DUF5659 domain-containing protein n=1 Tax=Sinobaca qinghaiensis TaxID=342944 RepID=A0A419VTW7_9BACL|nr:DUF5659 domain-containing protein [Sinobaca qinghaiensis]RKD84129.1 hypothetical protein ATL39_0062 [Sinobaca qinghaiensis]